MCESAFSKKNIEIRNPEAIRPWFYVLDTLSGYLTLAGKMLKDPINCNNAWNFGPLNDKDFTGLELVENIIGFWGSDKFEIEKGDFFENLILKLDVSKVKDKIF